MVFEGDPNRTPLPGNARQANPYDLLVIGSHLCIGCGSELRRVPAPPDPVYALPVCICPTCGTSVVRRKHRFRTRPYAFMRLDRAINHLAFATFMVALLSGAAALTAVIAVMDEEPDARAPVMTLIEHVRGASDSERFSIFLLVAILGGTQLLSGLILRRLLWHWRPVPLGMAWGGLLVAWCIGMLGFRWWLNPSVVTFWDAFEPAGPMLQILAISWVITLVGLFLGGVSARGQGEIELRRFRRVLKRARRRQRKGREG